MNWILGMIWLLLLANGLSAISNTDTNISNNSGYVKKDNLKVCIGTQSKLSVPSNKEQHFKNIRERYNNCTYIDGNLELTWIQDPNADLSFLENIQEVTGYVLINHIEVKNVRLPKLQIIRGTKLFKSNDHNYALMVAYTKIFTLELPSLREILQGSAGFYQNFHLCGVQSIDWTEIISEPNANFTYEYDFAIAQRTCECHKSCERGCWGPGEHNCQKFSKNGCSPQCAGGRCFGSKPRECCHLFCAGGCFGPTQTDCIACKNFYDDGVCKEECPPMQRYNPINYIWEQNPEGRYAYGATCVKSCPEHLLRDNGACVRSCPSNKMAKSGECIPCNGPCPKTCTEVPILNSANIDKFKNCTVIEGSIRILEQAFTGYSDIFQNFSMGQRYIPMHPDRLEVFSNVKEITGFFDVQAQHKDFKNLSYFRNLEVIHGRVLNDNYFAAFSIVSSSLSSLGLKNLKRINAGTVVIQNNEELCFVKNITWGSIIKVKEPKVVIPDNNMSPLKCRALNQVCSPECDRQGCWGKGADQCLNCLNMKFEENCISDCNIIPNTYKFDNRTCKSCHPECIGCVSAGDRYCHQCVNVLDDGRCVKECPENKYNDNGVCRQCHKTCEGCTGPNNNIGPGGCNTCSLAIINTNATVDRCLLKDDNCPDGYFWEYVNPQEQSSDLHALTGKAICRKCHPRCEICTNYGFHTEVCSKCSGYKRGEQCEDECPSDHYADEDKRECFECHSECKNCTGPTASNCSVCRNFKVLGEQDPFENSTIFDCTSKCPPDYPYQNFHEPRIGPYCSKAPPKGAKLAGADPSLYGFIVLGLCVIVVLAIIVWGYNCRQRNLAKKQAAKMSLVLTGYEDSEPLRPTNVGANLTKLRIIKEGELRKGGILGMGAFGKVYKGYWVPECENIKEKIPVAIKELLEVNGAESSKEFLEEAYIMASVDHPNLLKLLAICMTSQMMLITQLMPLGCLLDYVRNNKDRIGSKALLNWSTQIAKGMSYLEERGIVHRDLAARNVLVRTPSCVKITDFGLAKLLNHDSHKYIAAGGKMPIKWLAIECIRQREFTSKSDVWAFAVTIWEILTFGQKPYENIVAKELPDLIEQGLKLYQPECCSLDIYMKLVSCWHLDSVLRPTFKELVTIFADFARDPGGFLHIPGDKFTRLPAYTTQDEKHLIRNLAASTSRAAETDDTEDYLQPKPDNVGQNEESSDDLPNLNRYCKDPINKTSSGEGDETDSNLREIGVGNLRLDLPVDEDDYLMPTCQKNKGSTSSVNNLNNNNNLSTNANANAGYMDLIAGAPSIDNPEYLLNANSTGSNVARMLQGASMNSNTDNELVQTPEIPTQTLGIPVIKANGSSGNPVTLDVEQQNSDHEYYNDLQRELQPLKKTGGGETRV